MAERRYVLTKLARGDYLLPSNDGKTLYRIRSYTDGPSAGLIDVPRDFTVWQVKKWHRPLPDPQLADRYEDDDGWQFVADGFPTRRDAIEAALG